MNVELFNFSKRFNSTKVPTSGAGTTFTNVQLKDDTSIYAPVLLFAVSSFSVPTIAPTLYNYAVIAKFQRNYFIEDWTYRGNVWEAQLTIDVLGTYKTSIGLISTMVERSYTSYDGNLIDTMYSRTVNSQITSLSMSSAFYSVNPMNGCFVIGVVGYPPTLPLTANNNVGSVTYYAMDLYGITNICAWMYSNNIWTDLNITDISNGLFKSMFNPIQYLVSCTWFPFSPSSFSSSSQCHVMFGYWDTGVSGYPVNVYSMTADVTCQIPNHPQVARGAYLNYNPFTKATAFLPGVGSVPIDMSFRNGGDYVRARYLIDTHTGQADVKVSLVSYADMQDASDGNVFFSTSIMFGVPIQISQAIVQTIGSNGFSLGDISGLFGNFVKSSILPDLFARLGGKSTPDYDGGYPSVVSTGTNGSFNLVINKATLVVEHFRITDEDRAEFGRPLMQVKTINTLSGYVKCADAHVELPITDKEKKAITEFMNSGFFYE